MERIEKEIEKLEKTHFHKRNTILKKYKIKIIGEQVPKPLTNFTKMKSMISENLLQNLQKLGYKKPTPIQMQSVPLVLAKRNFVAIAPTGSGKTCAYLLPLFEMINKSKKLKVIIFAPT